MTVVSRNTVNRLYAAFRHRIAGYKRPDNLNTGVFKVYERSFGPRRVKDNRGCGTGSETIVFGLYKRDGKVYTEIVSDAADHALQRIIRGHTDIDSVIHNAGWRGYGGLVDLGDENHFHALFFLRSFLYLIGRIGVLSTLSLRSISVTGLPCCSSGRSSQGPR